MARQQGDPEPPVPGVDDRPTLQLDHLLTLQAPDGMATLVSASVGPTGEIVAVWSDAVVPAPPLAPPPEPASSRGLGRRLWDGLLGRRTHTVWADADGVDLFGDIDRRVVLAADPSTVVVAAHTVSGSEVLARIPELHVLHAVAQPLPDGEVLVVGAWDRRHPDGGRHDTVVVDADGRLLRTGRCGPGVQHVQASASGDIWLAYSERGVFGGFGAGTAGLVRYGRDLSVRWRFDGTGIEEHHEIDDCEALNVAGEQAWVCYYSDFPVVRIDGGVTTRWETEIADVRALVVHEDRVLLAGGWARSDLFTQGRLSGDTVEVTGAGRLVLPDGFPLLRTSTMIGRGPELTVVNGLRCYRLTLP
jgi:hypothetical protein